MAAELLNNRIHSNIQSLLSLILHFCTLMEEQPTYNSNNNCQLMLNTRPETKHKNKLPLYFLHCSGQSHNSLMTQSLAPLFITCVWSYNTRPLGNHFTIHSTSIPIGILVIGRNSTEFSYIYIYIMHTYKIYCQNHAGMVKFLLRYGFC